MSELDRTYLNSGISNKLINATVTNIVDGDTIDVRLDTGEIRRVRFGGGVNAPEMSTPEGLVSKAWVEKNIPIGSTTSLLDFADDSISSSDCDPYGRWPYPVVMSDGKIADVELVKNGLANIDYLNSGFRSTELINKKAMRDLYYGIYKDKSIVTATEVSQVPLEKKILDTCDILKMAQEKGWIDESGMKLPGACKIGVVWLPIPPSHICVSEVNENRSINTIRTPGDPKIKTGRQDIRIELEMFFPSIHEVNTKLRPLLAQFIRSPFLPLENEHIRNLIYPDVMWSEPTRVTRERGQNGILDAHVYERYADKDMTKGVFTHANEKFQRKVSDEFTRIRDSYFNELRNLGENIKKETNATTIKSLEKRRLEVIKSIKELRVEDIALRMIRDEKPANIYDDTQLAVVLRALAITTVPGYPETLQCNITLSVFNFIPYSEDFSFIQDIDSAIKQIEYFSGRENLKFPEDVREYFNYTEYQRPELKVTKNLSESEPFLAYIMPMLTGGIFSADRTVTMKTVDGKDEEKTTGFLFVSPENYLRSVADVGEFKRFNFEYEISEISLEEKEMFDLLQDSIQMETYRYFTDFLQGYIDKDIFSIYGERLGVAWRTIVRVMLFETIKDKVKYTLDAMKNYQEEMIELPFPIKEKGKPPIIDANKPYRVADFLERIKNGLPYANQMLANLGEVLRAKSLETYGYQNIYKFSFTEDADTVVTGITAAYETKLAPISLLSHTLPTYQYMGKHDWGVKLNIQTCNESLKRILRSLSSKAAYGRVIRNRSNKGWWVNKSNSLYLNPDTFGNGIFKLLGVNHVLVEDVVYEDVKDKPGWWNISLSLVQSDLDLFLYESLLPINFFDKTVVNDLKVAMKKSYTGKQDEMYTKIAEKYPYLAKYIFDQMQSYVYRQTYNVFYGGSSATPELPHTTSTPSGQITSYFGFRTNPVTGENQIHNGIDLTGNVNTPIPCLVDGIVTFAGEADINGNLVKVKHSNGYETRYAHLNSVSVQNGDRIKKGQIVGYMGNTGQVTGTHLHYGVYKDGNAVDPLLQQDFDPYNFPFVSNVVAKSRGYIVTDQDVQDIVRGGFNKNTFKQKLIEKFNELPPTISATKVAMNNLGNVVTTAKDFIRGGSQQMASNSANKVLGKDSNAMNKVDTKLLYNGDVLSQQTFMNRLDDKFKLISTINVPLSQVNELMEANFLQTLAIRYLLVAPKEALNLLVDNGSKYAIKDVMPQWNVNTVAGDTTYDLYSNYFDLNLPSYKSGILSTPADFFYRRFDKVFSFDVLDERIRRTKENYMNAWKFQLVDGFAMYEKLSKIQTYPFAMGPEDMRMEEHHLKTMKKRMDDIAYEISNIQFVEKQWDANEKIPALRVEYNHLKRSYDEGQTALSQQINTFKGKNKNSESNKDQYEKIINLAKTVHSQYGEDVKRMSIDNKMSYAAEQRISVIRQAMGLATCLRLAEIQNELELQERSLKVKSESGQLGQGIPPQYNRLYLIRQDLISQVMMFSEMPTQDLYGVVTPWSLEESQDIIDRIRDAYNVYKAKDKTHSMERAYPTLKLYFIEEDSKQWGQFDDYYMYNAIEDIEVIHSKNAASFVANITISNISRNLSDPYAIYNVESSTSQQTSDEQALFTMYLREGVTIMIKAGFDNNPANLNTIFMGKIISCSAGDRVSIVAQSFGAELLEPINQGVGIKRGYCSPCRTHGDIVLWAANTLSGMEHFGSPNMYERLGFIDTHGATPYYAAPKWRAWDFLKSMHPILDVYFRFAVYDPRFENVYLPYSKLCMSPMSQVLADMLVNAVKAPGKAILKTIAGVSALTIGVIGLTCLACALPLGLSAGAVLSTVGGFLVPGITIGTVVKLGTCLLLSYAFGTLLEGLGRNDNMLLFWHSTFDWVIPDDTSLWDLLQEVSLYHDDFITTVLPYNEFIPGQVRQTLYVGPRDGVYKYTDVFDNKETFDRFVKDIQFKRKFMGMVMDQSERKRIQKEYDSVVKDANKLKAKQQKNGLDYSELVRYHDLLAQIREYENLRQYIARYEGVPEFASASQNALEVAMYQQRLNNIKDPKIRKEVLAAFNELSQVGAKEGTPQFKKTMNERFSREIGKTIDEIEEEYRDSMGEQKYDMTRLDYISAFVDYKYGHFMTKDEEDLRYIPFETSGIMFAINNPEDLMHEVNGKKYCSYPGYMNVVNYYYIDSFSHIISNDIRASAEDVYNHVIVKYPPDPTLKQTTDLMSKEFWADDNIRGGNVRTYVSEQRNIDPLSVPFLPGDFEQWLEFRQKVGSKKLYGKLPRVYQVGYNILANHMRPMYRGSITVIGMPYVKPYDIIFINDYYTNMWGPIEVETVKHRFNSEGFTTEIVPNAVISYMHPGKVAELAFMQGLQLPLIGLEMINWSIVKTIGTVSGVAGTAAGIGTAAGATSAALPWVIGLGGFGGALGLCLSMSMWNMGVGKFLGRDIINVCGLWLNSRPLTAGMEGAYKDNVQVHMLDNIQNLVDFDVMIQGV